MTVIGNKWDEILGSEYVRPYFETLMEKVKAEYKTHTVFPPYDLMFAALKTVDYDDVKVVILGQDPYHGDGQANVFAGDAVIEIKGAASSTALGDIYACGAQQRIPIGATAGKITLSDPSKYTVSGKVSVFLEQEQTAAITAAAKSHLSTSFFLFFSIFLPHSCF